MGRTKSKKHYTLKQKGCSRNCTRKHKHKYLSKRKVGGTGSAYSPSVYPATDPSPPDNGNFFINQQGSKRGGSKRGGGCGCGLIGGNTFLGSPWTPDSNTWTNSNHYPLNNYNTDIQGSIQNLGANRPFIGGKKKRGGNSLINLLPQDLVNLGRSSLNNVHGTYNAANGYAPPTNPLPYKEQIPNLPNISAINNFKY